MAVGAADAGGVALVVHCYAVRCVKSRGALFFDKALLPCRAGRRALVFCTQAASVVVTLLIGFGD